MVLVLVLNEICDGEVCHKAITNPNLLTNVSVSDLCLCFYLLLVFLRVVTIHLSLIPSLFLSSIRDILDFIRMLRLFYYLTVFVCMLLYFVLERVY